jgi:hypothetical protein
MEESNPAVVDGVDVDAVFGAVQACAGVSGLSGGLFGEVGSYLPGRRVPGVIVRPDSVQVQVVARWGATTRDLLRQITCVLTPLVKGRQVEIVVADIDDPPSTAAAVTALNSAPAPRSAITAESPVADTRGGVPIAL